MPTYLFIHPFVSALAGSLILLAFLTKSGRRRLFAFHYLTGFTSFAAQLPPYDVTHTLSRYYQIIERVIGKYGGHIDNYMGDGLLAIFNKPNSQQSSLLAIQASLDVIEEFDQLARYFQSIYKRKLDVRIGLHCGQVVVGEMGSPSIKRSSIVGDTVNFASRIEEANKAAGTSLLISNETYQLVKDRVVTGGKVTIDIQGKEGVQILYEVTGLKY